VLFTNKKKICQTKKKSVTKTSDDRCCSKKILQKKNSHVAQSSDDRCCSKKPILLKKKNQNTNYPAAPRAGQGRRQKKKHNSPTKKKIKHKLPSSPSRRTRATTAANVFFSLTDFTASPAFSLRAVSASSSWVENTFYRKRTHSIVREHSLLLACCLRLLLLGREHILS